VSRQDALVGFAQEVAMVIARAALEAALWEP
jgi:hypothetical protein